jgi:hypothetical protein
MIIYKLHTIIKLKNESVLEDMSCVWEGRGAGSWFGEEVTKRVVQCIAKTCLRDVTKKRKLLTRAMKEFKCQKQSYTYMIHY